MEAMVIHLQRIRVAIRVVQLLRRLHRRRVLGVVEVVVVNHVAEVERSMTMARLVSFRKVNTLIVVEYVVVVAAVVFVEVKDTFK